MLYNYKTEYTTKHSATSYDQDTNSTDKTLLQFKHVDIVSGLMA